MADANELKVHSVVTRDEASFQPADFGKAKTVLTFWVGVHGPFRFEYSKDQATTERMNQDIDSKVQQIRLITQGR